MATVTTPSRPKLSVCLERLQATAENIASVSRAYQTAKTALQSLEADPNCVLDDAGMVLRLAGVDIPIPLTEDSEQRLEILRSATASLGQEIVRLWEVAHATVTEARAHCSQAAAQAGGN